MTLEMHPLFPVGFDAWPPLWQAATVFFSSFVLEDVAAVGAGLLLATGMLQWPMAFGACFLGIWLGDIGLYAIARIVGRGWLDRSSLRRLSSRALRSERWFAERGDVILLLSRLLPGARLPTYLAAGFLRLPLRRFLAVTGGASLVWTVVILFATQLIGNRLVGWLDGFRHAGWVLLAVIPVFLFLLQAARYLAARGLLTGLFSRLARYRHWEFWPAWMFYPPVAAWCLWLAVRHGSLRVATAANPGIFSGGIIGESKMATLQQLMETSPEFTADAELLAGTTPEDRLRSIQEICSGRAIGYPFILKPDVGQRGAGVKLIRDEAQARAYLTQTAAPLVLQRYVPGPHEVGVFYYRFPHEHRGHIFSITEKVFPVVTGDGCSTVAELIRADPRARFMARKYLHRLKSRGDEVLPPGGILRLVEAGNHAQGCIFKDGMRFCTPELINRIHRISRKLSGFYLGRYDIRFAHEEDLRAGRNFSILELNGAASEATSVYDARNSLISAYRTLFRQWKLVFAIGAENRRNGCRPTACLDLWRKWREFRRYAVTYPVAD